MKIMRYRPLSAEDRLRLGRKIDEWHAELSAAGADKVRLVERIGDAQALINVSEGGGYGAGAAIKRYVTARPGHTSLDPLGLGARATKQERYMAARSQLSKLDHAWLDLMSGEPRLLLDGIRNIGKFGKRLKETIGEAWDDAVFDGFVSRCEKLKAAADDAGVASRMGQGEVQALSKEAHEIYAAMRGDSARLLAIARSQAGLQDSGVLRYVTVGHVKLLRATDATLTGLNLLQTTLKLGKLARPGETTTPPSASVELEEPEIVSAQAGDASLSSPAEDVRFSSAVDGSGRGAPDAEQLMSMP